MAGVKNEELKKCRVRHNFLLRSKDVRSPLEQGSQRNNILKKELLLAQVRSTAKLCI